ncbi:Pycsar system effector family protein [Natronomonas sp. LN261]|uniref:Pycsar system effector family protein n=1 Tax=Natronomonas sp. LN261 TaxID=2750669 RepID=UPI0015EE46D8|nr:Pycsar system effector family protein [Natronomonas sp. LN261]
MTDEETADAEKTTTGTDAHKGNEADITAVQFSQLVRDHQNSYIRVADNKASILLSGLVAYLGLSLSVIGTNFGCEGVLFLGAAGVSVSSAVIGIYFAASAVYPSTPSTPQGLIMWESIVKKGEKGYRETIRSKSSDELLNELIDENYKLATVNNTKYQQVRRALQATIPTVGFGIIAMILLVIS